MVTGAGGSTIKTGGAPGTTVQPATGGAPASSGMGFGGAWGGSGGTASVGGELFTGGRLGMGGATGSGSEPGPGGAGGTGGRTNTGGGIAVGGTVVRVGGMNGSGGATDPGGTMLGSGGSFATGGTTGPGASLATGGRTGDGGVSVTGGVSGAGGVAAGGATGNGGTSGTVTWPPKFFGNIDTTNQIRSDFATYWDQLAPENVGKWLWVQGTSATTFDWARVDALYKYCEDNHIIFKEHSFVWGLSQASWINSTDAVAAVQNWMKTFCERYPKTRLIDVVDEPLHSTPSYATAIGGGSHTTWDWVANSFKWAHEACPNAVLILNDYNIIEYSSERSAIIALAKTILAAGAPVMALGAQAHDAYWFSGSTLQAVIADIASQTGLPVYITQLDIPVADDAQQAAIMKDLVTTFWNDANVPGITYWGYIVGATWRSNTGLIKSDGTMRPAMIWLMDFLRR